MVVLLGLTRQPTPVLAKIKVASLFKPTPTQFLKAVVMDCRKRICKRICVSALFQSANCGLASQLGSDRLPPSVLTETHTGLANSACSRINTEQQSHEMRSSSRYRVIARGLELPAIAVPAVLPLLVLIGIVFVGFPTVPCLATSGVQSVSGVQGSSRTQAVNVQQLIEQLSQTDFDQRESAEQQLVEIGSPAVDQLIGTLRDCKPDVCSRVKRILQAVAGKCDEESLFKVLAALRIRFDVSDQRIKPLLNRWAIQSRSAVVDRWREEGAIVVDPFGGEAAMDDLELREKQMAAQRIFRIDGGVIEVTGNGAGISSPRPSENSPRAKQPDRQAATQPIATRLQTVLDGSLQKNKELVLNSSQGATGFEKSLSRLQAQPVSVIIGENWQGDFSAFDLARTQSTLLVSSFEIQKKTISDSLLSVLDKHPVTSLTLNDCSVAANVKGTLPGGLQSLAIENSDNSIKLLELIASGDSSRLRQVGFKNSEFGKDQTIALSGFPGLSHIELEGLDLEQDAFEGMASLRWLNQVEINGCKFPAEAFLKFQQERRNVVVNFKAKAFLGVSGNRDLVFRRGGDLPIESVDGAGCVITTVIHDEAAERAGMVVGDVVLSFDGQKIESFRSLQIVIAQCDIGEEVPIEIRRNGKEQTLKVKMGEREDLK